MSTHLTNLILCASLLAFTSCTSKEDSKPDTKETRTDHLADDTDDKDIASSETTDSGQNKLTHLYSQAIADYITEVHKQNLIVFDTLFFGKRRNGQPDDFPEIVLPERIQQIPVRLVSPEEGKTLQEEKMSRVYINLMGWVEEDNANFIFVTFTHGFEHAFDYHIDYTYDTDRKTFDKKQSRVEKFRTK